ncbi:hypothetical protein [Hymenobacter jeollabukensis]|uniref:Uncharacterized protein n=1 Tax=Hymenobacter jeollabukensis TaxID=2025313 RepID=A0A5R8WR04_9BACT|nr:hypothetical protein [Hymenobacter jeollabukensis]TLM93165.1 hypothetical protein FDY95_11085 [Hymenobacter jeollabukensis]
MILSSTWLVTLSRQLNVLSIAAALVPVAIGLLYWRHLTPTGRCLWACSLLASLLLGVMCEYGRIVWHNNILPLRSQVWLETVLLTAAYYYTFTSPKRRIIPWLIGAFTLGAIGETVWLMDWRVGNGPYLHVLQAMLLIGVVLAYFEQLLNNPSPGPLKRNPMFVASVGVMFYYAGTVFVYVLERIMRQDTDQIRMMFNIEYALRIVALNGGIAAALWLIGRQRGRPARAFR